MPGGAPGLRLARRAPTLIRWRPCRRPRQLRMPSGGGQRKVGPDVRATTQRVRPRPEPWATPRRAMRPVCEESLEPDTRASAESPDPGYRVQQRDRLRDVMPVPARPGNGRSPFRGGRRSHDAWTRDGLGQRARGRHDPPFRRAGRAGSKGVRRSQRSSGTTRPGCPGGPGSVRTPEHREPARRAVQVACQVLADGEGGQRIGADEDQPDVPVAGDVHEVRKPLPSVR